MNGVGAGQQGRPGKLRKGVDDMGVPGVGVPYGIECPVCEAPAGLTCGGEDEYHVGRLRAWRGGEGVRRDIIERMRVANR